jgi:hypothetical protein
LTAKSDASGSYDLRGTHPLAARCIAARTAFPTNTSAIDMLTPPALSIPLIDVKAGDTFTITASVVGGLNVIDVGGSVKAGTDAVIELDGAGDADTVMVLRIGGKLSMLLRSAVSLTNGLTPEHTLIYVKGRKCLLADLSIGAGTVLCSPGRVKTGRTVAWVGAVFGDAKLLKVGEKTVFHYTPFQGF